MINIAKSAATDFTQTELAQLETAIEHLQGWDGRFSAESVSATIYAYVSVFFQKSLLHDYSDSESHRLRIVDNYNFLDYLERLLLDVSSTLGSDFNKVCRGAFSEYQG